MALVTNAAAWGGMAQQGTRTNATVTPVLIDSLLQALPQPHSSEYKCADSVRFGFLGL